MEETYLERIKKLKSERKITNDKLSEMTGIPLGTLSKLLAGINDSPKLTNIIAISQALGCSLDWMITGVPENTNNYTLTPEEMDLVEGYRKAKTGKKLVLVGPLDDSEYCRAVQQQAQDDPNIIMTDYVVGDPLKELYSNCGLFVLPSHTEGLSLSLLEALSIGARCLVSDIPENTVVTDIYGAAFKPEDTDDLARALERECAQEYPDAMRQQQIEYVHTNFEYDVMLDRYEEVYHHVVGDPLKAMPSTLKKKKVPAGAKA